MEEYRKEFYAKRPDGSLGAFPVFVGLPEEVDVLLFRCQVMCPLVSEPKFIHSASARHARVLAFNFIKRMVEYSDLELVDAEGRPDELKVPPDVAQGS